MEMWCLIIGSATFLHLHAKVSFVERSQIEDCAFRSTARLRRIPSHFAVLRIPPSTLLKWNRRDRLNVVE